MTNSTSYFTPQTVTATALLCHPQLIEPMMRLGVRPGVGNATIEEMCSGTSTRAQLMAEVFNVLVYSEYSKKNALVKYDLMPMADFLKRTYLALEMKAFVLEKHLAMLTNGLTRDREKWEAVSAFCHHLCNSIRKHAESEAGAACSLTVLYELFYSPSSESNDLISLKKATGFTGTTADKELQGELADMQNLLIRHATGDYDSALFSAVFQHTIAICNDLNGLIAVKEKLTAPIVADMVKGINKRWATATCHSNTAPSL